jgi:hypothetical protein
MPTPNRISGGEAIAGKLLTETTVGWSDGTIQDTGAGATLTRYTPAFTATGLTFTGTGVTHPAYKSYYTKIGHQVTFWIEIDLITVTNFGTGQLKTEMPFMPFTNTMHHFSAWVNVDPAVNPDFAGHVLCQADHLANTQVLDLHWYQASTANPKPIMEKLLTQSSPVTLTTATQIYINGTYIALDGY